MGSFSFSETAGTSQSTAKPRLEGNNIYSVKFQGCELQDIVGVKDPTALYKVLKLKFSNEDGTFEHTIFEPKENDFDRRETEYTKNGKVEKIPQPSNVESMMLLFKHAIDAINPTIAKQIDDGSKNLGAKDWDTLRALVAKILDAGKDSETHIKLVKNNKGEAAFPGFFAGLTREGKAYIKNNFIGDKLAFSTYESQKIKDAAGAKPTTAKSYDANTFTPQATAAASDLYSFFDIADL